MKHPALVTIAAALALAASARAATGQYQYTLTNLGSLGAPGACAYGINKIAGYATTAGGVQHPFLYSAGVMQDLALAPGYPASSSGGDDWMAISGNGQVAFRAAGAFVYTGTQMQPLVPVGQPCDVNDSGQVVGYTGWTAGCLWSGGQAQTLGGYIPQAINNSGEYVGSFNGQAFAYVGGQYQMLGTLGGRSSAAFDVNDLGQIAGTWVTATGDTHAFLYDGTQMNDLGSLGQYGFVWGMNLSGQVVGNTSTPSGDFRAFVYADGAIEDLNSLIAPGSGLTLEFADDVNDAGQIVGEAFDAKGNSVAFLLTPTPEPATLSLLAIGGLAILRRGTKLGN
jgi:probable HAF family extracellular repeat protein